VKTVSSAHRSHFMSAILTHSARRRSRAPRFRKASEYARLIRETTSESPQIFREGKKAVQALGIFESASQILQPITLRAP
jgi:hypothetical protein